MSAAIVASMRNWFADEKFSRLRLVSPLPSVKGGTAEMVPLQKKNVRRATRITTTRIAPATMKPRGALVM